jgi:hypothetical protein
VGPTPSVARDASAVNHRPSCADDGVVSIDLKVAELGDALEAAGLPRPRPPASRDALDELTSAIAPLRLPEEVRRFWELVDVDSLAVRRYPPIHDPAGSLCLWTQNLDPPGTLPRVLLPLAYESHAFVLVELHGPDDAAGGALFTWGYGDVEFSYIGDSIGNLVDHTIDALRGGWLEHFEDGDIQILPNATGGGGCLDDRLSSASHPSLGEIASIPGQARSWPHRWLTLSGIPVEHLTPAGADYTIAGALAALASGHPQARIQGSVIRLAGNAEHVSVTVSDGTADMQVVCPASVTALGPHCPGRFEFAIVAAAPDAAAPMQPFPGDVVPAHLAGLLEQYREVMTGRPDAIATEVRPLDPPAAGG